MTRRSARSLAGKESKPNENRESPGGDEYGMGHGISEYTEGGGQGKYF